MRGVDLFGVRYVERTQNETKVGLTQRVGNNCLLMPLLHTSCMRFRTMTPAARRSAVCAPLAVNTLEMSVQRGTLPSSACRLRL